MSRTFESVFEQPSTTAVASWRQAGKNEKWNFLGPLAQVLGRRPGEHTSRAEQRAAIRQRATSPVTAASM